MVGDKDYASRNIGSYLSKRGIACTIPEGVDQIGGRLRRGESLCRLTVRSTDAATSCVARAASAAVQVLLAPAAQRAQVHGVAITAVA
ncbi:hypothetical protein AB0F20_38820 [Streptomyces goshikiensis]